ncbi:UDP-4-amino-4-deoxy-L-arabinose--oxoglutarate aminotransferase [Candidatus Rubidus massiliensis]|nr:MAG: aminotransferase [Chlamydia sp. 32-24]CDZ81717.1 UDP-4-amino-4-deoxy-L-arabinose--oxoglutarate aminotransferase [Candidatus Rubidus massiliensis]
MHFRPFENPIYVTRPMLPDLESIYQGLNEVWDSKTLTNGGPKHQKLEKEISNYLKVPYNCLFNNGTIALITACQALRLTGEVITTPFTFPATPHVLAWNNIQPVFCDIDPKTMNIDHRKIESLITNKTSAILGVHVYGTPCEVDEIEEIANRHGLRVIYDAAHAFGLEINGRGIGTYGDISMFSFHATKLFHTVEGGCLTFNDPYLKPRIDLLKNFGIKNENEVILPGINGKLNEVQASIGLTNLTLIEDERKKRAAIIQTYQEELFDVEGISYLKTQQHVRPSLQYFIIRINKDKFGISRDELHAKLKEYNVVTRKYFYPLCSDYTCYNSLPSSSPANLVIANQVVHEVLALPLYGDLELEDVKTICKMIKSLSPNKNTIVKELVEAAS